MAKQTGYGRDLGRCKRFTAEEERRLCGQVRRGQKARQLLIESMLPYIVQRSGKWLQHGKDAAWCSRRDLIQEANLALIDVVDNRFDPDKGRLITILSSYIRRAFQRTESRQSPIRVPIHYLECPGTPDRRYQRQADAARNAIVGLDCIENVDYHLSEDTSDAGVDWGLMLDRVLGLLDALGDVTPRDRDVMRGRLCGVACKDLALKHGLSLAMIGSIVQRLKHRLSYVVMAEREKARGEP